MLPPLRLVVGWASRECFLYIYYPYLEQEFMRGARVRSGRSTRCRSILIFSASEPPSLSRNLWRLRKDIKPARLSLTRYHVCTRLFTSRPLQMCLCRPVGNANLVIQFARQNARPKSDVKWAWGRSPQSFDRHFGYGHGLVRWRCWQSLARR